ncbi:MAG TPA: hypothetical protein VKH64_14525 [Candidatus Binatia bacterium]|nr:hypothetical protein [Candidatus Binatia bacterium]
MLVTSAVTAKATGTRHWTAAVLLFTLLALPFHIHAFTATPQLAQECSCYQGARTCAIALPQPADFLPSFQPTVVHQEQPRLISRIAFDFHSIRAPPSLVVL